MSKTSQLRLFESEGRKTDAASGTDDTLTNCYCNEIREDHNVITQKVITQDAITQRYNTITQTPIALETPEL